MVKKIAIIGGDLRIIQLTEMLAKDNFEIYTYAIEKAKSIEKIENVKQSHSMKDAIESSEIIIGPMPLSSNGLTVNTPFSDKIVTLEELASGITGKIFMAGNIKKDFYSLVEVSNTKIIDLLEREELAILNAISTAEGAIQIAMEQTTRTLHGSKILILGFGRIGKVLANRLRAMGANVFCEARKDTDLAWIKAYGYEPLKLENLDNELEKFNIVMNTIPSMILQEERLKKLDKDCLIIDLASNPGGVDRDCAKKLGINTIWALALPGKVAPLTSAEFIKDTVYHIWKEI